MAVLNLPHHHLQSQASPVTSIGSSCTANSSQNSAVISHGGHSVPAYFSGDNLGFICSSNKSCLCSKGRASTNYEYSGGSVDIRQVSVQASPAMEYS